MSIFHYLNEYLKINTLASYALVLCGVLSALKYVKVFQSIKIPKPVILALIVVLGLGLRLGWLNFSSYEPVMQRSIEGQYTENDLINFFAVDITKGKWFLTDDGHPTGRRVILHSFGNSL